MRYNHWAIISGNVIETFESEFSVRCGEVFNPTGRRGKDRAISDGEDLDEEIRRKEKNREKVLQRARSMVRRLINANCYQYYDDAGQVIRPKFVTLTFRENETKIKDCNYKFRNFRRRLEYALGIKLKYVCVVEFQKRGAVHYHVLFFNLPYISQEELSSIWSHGFVWINALTQKDGKDIDNIGAYISKYMSKDADDERLKGEKCYFTSRGLIKPEKRIMTEKEIENLDQTLSQHKVYENVFCNDYHGTLSYKQYNLLRQKNNS